MPSYHLKSERNNHDTGQTQDKVGPGAVVTGQNASSDANASLSLPASSRIKTKNCRQSDRLTMVSFAPFLLATSASPAAQVVPKAAGTSSLSKPIIFATSGLGGCLGWMIIHPANTLAVRMSLASMSGRPFSFKAMIAESGWMGLYDGLSAGVLRQVFYATSRFGLCKLSLRLRAHRIIGNNPVPLCFSRIAHALFLLFALLYY